MRQRVYALALGYEELVDHDELRRDSLLAAVVGRAPRGGGRGTGDMRWPARAPSGEASGDRYRRIALDPVAVDSFFVDVLLDAHPEPPEQIVLDLDATDDLIHGAQEGRFFHGYYGGYCYLPLHVFCGSHLLCARLRRSNIDASAGSLEEVERIVGQGPPLTRSWSASSTSTPSPAPPRRWPPPCSSPPHRSP